MPEQLRHFPLRNSVIDLYIANFQGATNAGSAGSSFGLKSIPEAYKYLIDKIKQQIPTDHSKFNDDFINYKEGIILCVNTSALLNKQQYQNSNSFSNSLKFTVVKIPGDFIGVNKSQLSSAYAYGERLRVSASFEKDPKGNQNIKTLTYRDTNIKGRSRTGGQSIGGIGVWS